MINIMLMINLISMINRMLMINSISMINRISMNDLEEVRMSVMSQTAIMPKMLVTFSTFPHDML